MFETIVMLAAWILLFVMLVFQIVSCIYDIRRTKRFYDKMEADHDRIMNSLDSKDE